MKARLRGTFAVENIEPLAKGEKGECLALHKCECRLTLQPPTILPQRHSRRHAHHNNQPVRHARREQGFQRRKRLGPHKISLPAFHDQIDSEDTLGDEVDP